MQLKFKHVSLLVIDEKSMIGQKQLLYVHKRLQEARPDKGNEPFGGLYSWGIGNSCLQFWTAHTTRILLNCKEERMQLGKRNERKMPSLLDISSRHRPICSTTNWTRVSFLQRSNNRKEMLRQNFVLNSSVLERESSLRQTGIDGSASLLILFQMLKRLPSLNTDCWHVL
jgi:hypothetical protein